MLHDLASKIKKMRLGGGFSQTEVARGVGVSRPTYAQIEGGKRELTLTEAEKTAGFFGMELTDFLAEGETSRIRVDLQSAGKKRGTPKKPEIRISVPQENVKKFREVLLYVLGKVGAYPQVGETVIYKLLYFIDFDYYEKYEEQLIGAKYIKNHHGPTPVEFGKIVNDMEKRGEIEKIKSKYFQYEQRKYLPRRAADLSVLSARELAMIEDVLRRLGRKNAKELSEYSHEDIPWKTHKAGEVIDYESVFYRDEKYSVREYPDEI